MPKKMEAYSNSWYPDDSHHLKNGLKQHFQQSPSQNELYVPVPSTSKKRNVIHEALRAVDTAPQTQDGTDEGIVIDRQRAKHYMPDVSSTGQLHEEGHILGVRPKKGRISTLSKPSGQLSKADWPKDTLCSSPSHTVPKQHQNHITKDVKDTLAEFNYTLAKDCKTSRFIQFDDKVDEEGMGEIIKELLNGSKITVLGRGTFGSVLSSDSLTKKKAVMKLMTKKVNSNEILVPLSFGDCPNIVRIHSLCVYKGNCLIVQQHCGSSLKHLCSTPYFMSFVKDNSNFRDLMMGIFNGVAYLEKCRVCHGDLKLENITARFENNTWVPCLIDFGSSHANCEEVHLDGITPEFLPPAVNAMVHQSLHNRSRPTEGQGQLLFTEKADSWATAIVGLVVFDNGNHPVRKVRENTQNVYELRMNAMEVIAKLTDKDIDLMIPPALDDIMSKAFKANLCLDPSRRWGAAKTLAYLQQDKLTKESSNVIPLHIQGDDIRRGIKRPVSPYKPVDEDMSDLMNFFGKQYNNPKDQTNRGVVVVKQSMAPTAPQGCYVADDVHNGDRSMSKAIKVRLPQQVQQVFAPIQVGPANGSREEAPFVHYMQQPHRRDQMPRADVELIAPIAINPYQRSAVRRESNDIQMVEAAPVFANISVRDVDQRPPVQKNDMPDFDLLGISSDLSKNDPNDVVMANRGAGGKNSRRRYNSKNKKC